MPDDGPGDEPADYTDAYTLPAPLAAANRSRSAEDWARAAFEGAPAGMRWFLLICWRWLLGIRLGPHGSSDHVLGWRIMRRTPDKVILGARSAVVGETRLIFSVTESGVSAGTNLYYTWPGAKLIWAMVSLLHRPIIHYLLTRAARSR